MIISASRRTDIPAFYSDWFFSRLSQGFAMARNPMNPRQVGRISLSAEDVRCFVFWSKNPNPMLGRLGKLEAYSYYFQFTLNAYGDDIEGSLPCLDERLETFTALSAIIGPERVIWRYDPIMLTDKYTVGYHINGFDKIASCLAGCTEKVTISFIDFYNKITNNIKRLGIRKPNPEEMHLLAKELSYIAARHGLAIDTCAEVIDLSAYGISHAACIDGRLVEKITGRSFAAGKDKNQRPGCGCAPSMDIGAYNSCPGGCAYCYANHSKSSIEASIKRHEPYSPFLIGCQEGGDKVKDRR